MDALKKKVHGELDGVLKKMMAAKLKRALHKDEAPPEEAPLEEQAEEEAEGEVSPEVADGLDDQGMSEEEKRRLLEEYERLK